MRHVAISYRSNRHSASKEVIGDDDQDSVKFNDIYLRLSAVISAESDQLIATIRREIQLVCEMWRSVILKVHIFVIIVLHVPRSLCEPLSQIDIVFKLN